MTPPSDRDDKDNQDDKDAERTEHDLTRRRVLARRATFVAAALAGVSSACGKEPNTSTPCLTPVPTETAQPSVCLTPVEPSSDAGAPPPTPTTMTTSDAGRAGPVPCLSVRIRPQDEDAGPMPCLKIAPPQRDAK